MLLDDAMTDVTDKVAGIPAPGANASPNDATPADAARDESGSEAGSPPAAADAGDSSEKAVKDLQQRVNKTTRNWREAERERDYWREQALKPQTPAEPAQTPSREADTGDEPLKTEADFNYDSAEYAKYLQARIDRIAEAKAERVVEKRLQAERERAEAAKRDGDFNARVETFKKDAPDFDDVVTDPSLPITTQMADVIRKHELGPALAYHLGKNPEVAAQISRLPAADAAFELGQIAAEIRVKRAAPPPAPSVTKAPPPTPKLDATDATPPVRTTDSSGDSLSDDDWIRMERKRLARKR